MNIVLIGFMGTGKTSVAKAISEKTGMKTVELDAEIEKAAKKTVPAIFESEGEAGFRKLEAGECRKASLKDGVVISCGGGVVLDPENVSRLKKNGKIFWLRASAKAVLSRLATDTTPRPLLEAGGLKKIEELMAFRETLYERAADYAIQTEDRPVGEIADEILRLARPDPD